MGIFFNPPPPVQIPPPYAPIRAQGQQPPRLPTTLPQEIARLAWEPSFPVWYPPFQEPAEILPLTLVYGSQPPRTEPLQPPAVWWQAVPAQQLISATAAWNVPTVVSTFVPYTTLPEAVLAAWQPAPPMPRQTPPPWAPIPAQGQQPPPFVGQRPADVWWQAPPVQQSAPGTAGWNVPAVVTRVPFSPLQPQILAAWVPGPPPPQRLLPTFFPGLSVDAPPPSEPLQPPAVWWQPVTPPQQTAPGAGAIPPPVVNAPPPTSPLQPPPVWWTPFVLYSQAPPVPPPTPPAPPAVLVVEWGGDWVPPRKRTMKPAPLTKVPGEVRLYRMRFWLQQEIASYGDSLTGTPSVSVVKDPVNPGTGPGERVLAGTPTIYGVVNSLTITAGGTGYNAPPYSAGNQAPAVAITGGGASSVEGGAQAAATVSQTVASVTVSNGGSGYTTPPTVTFTPPVGTNNLPVTGGVAATGTAVLSGGAVSSVTITNAGSGYVGAPSIIFDGGGGTGAAASATMNTGVVTGLTVTSPGRGYTSTASVAIVGGDGAGATATASMQYGEVRFTLSGGSDLSNYRVSCTVNTVGGSTLTGVGELFVRAAP